MWCVAEGGREHLCMPPNLQNPGLAHPYRILDTPLAGAGAQHASYAQPSPTLTHPHPPLRSRPTAPALLLRPQHVHTAHVVQPVCELDEDDEGLRKRQVHNHLAQRTEVLRRVVSPALRLAGATHEQRFGRQATCEQQPCARQAEHEQLRTPASSLSGPQAQP